MAYFDDIPVKRISLISKPEYWVEVATDFTYGDSKKFAGDTGDALAPAMAANVFLLTAIKAWNLDDKNGVIVPITQENIDLLSRNDAIAIISEANSVTVEEDSKKKTS